MKKYNISQAADKCGVHPSVLRIWELRYDFPAPKRKANGYRVYSEAMVEAVKKFIAAGRPFHEIQAGVWQPRIDVVLKPPESNHFYVEYVGKVEKGLIQALLNKRISQVIYWIEQLVLLHPTQRSTYIACMNAANTEQHGIYTNILRKYNAYSPCGVHQEKEGANPMEHTERG